MLVDSGRRIRLQGVRETKEYRGTLDKWIVPFLDLLPLPVLEIPVRKFSTRRGAYRPLSLLPPLPKMPGHLVS